MSDYSFLDGTLYRFHIRGQNKTVATSDQGTDVHVVRTDPTSQFQVWIATLDVKYNVTRFRNLATQAFLEKNTQGKYLKAASHDTGEYQNFLAAPFGTGWHLKLIVGPLPDPVVVAFDGSDEWLSLAQQPTTIYDIDVVGPPGTDVVGPPGE